MDRRQEPRAPVDRQAVVTIRGGPQQQPLQASITDVSSHGMRVMLPLAVSPGVALLIESENIHYSGTVIYCGQMAAGWATGIEILHLTAIEPVPKPE